MIMENKIAVYGGAFDPLTVAHEAIIQYLLENYPLVHVYLTDNDEKQYNASFQDRYAMLITRFPKLNIHKQSARTFDTLETVYGKYASGLENRKPDIDLILGMDELNSLLAGEWTDSDKITSKYDIRVFNRGGNFNFHTEFGEHENIKPIFVNIPNVSSTDVRKEMYMNPMYGGTAVSSPVLGYISTHGLYHQVDPITHCLEEQAELAKYEPGNWPKPSVTATFVVINAVGDDAIAREDQVLLVRRKSWPFADYWCLPGGHTNPHESIEQCGSRELREETGLNIFPENVHQLKVYSPEDPRGLLKNHPDHWIYDVGVYVRGIFGPVKGEDDADEAAWFPISVARKTRLAFHHNQILEDYITAVGGNHA